MTEFWMCFVPLFVAVDPPGILPIFTVLTKGVSARQRRRLILASVITASAVAIVFVYLGSAVLTYMGITLFDFMIAGGVILFAIALVDLMTAEKRQRRVDPSELGPVPIGVPLIVGPAVLTTALVLKDTFGFPVTVLALLANVGIAGIAFLCVDKIRWLIGDMGEKILSKLASLLMAALAVMLVRQGITGAF